MTTKESRENWGVAGAIVASAAFLALAVFGTGCAPQYGEARYRDRAAVQVKQKPRPKPCRFTVEVVMLDEVGVESYCLAVMQSVQDDGPGNRAESDQTIACALRENGKNAIALPHGVKRGTLAHEFEHLVKWNCDTPKGLTAGK